MSQYISKVDVWIGRWTEEQTYRVILLQKCYSYHKVKSKGNDKAIRQ